jgi:hypothetical protein
MLIKLRVHQSEWELFQWAQRVYDMPKRILYQPDSEFMK